MPAAAAARAAQRSPSGQNRPARPVGPTMTGSDRRRPNRATERSRVAGAAERMRQQLDLVEDGFVPAQRALVLGAAVGEIEYRARQGRLRQRAHRRDAVAAPPPGRDRVAHDRAARSRRAAASSAASSRCGVTRSRAWRASMPLTAAQIAVVVRHGNAERVRLAHERAVEGLDLRPPPALDMLEHGGPVVALEGVIQHVAAQIGIGQPDALRRGDGEDLVEQPLQQQRGRRMARDLARPQPRERGDRIDRAVQDELRPHMSHRVVAGGGRKAGGRQLRGQRVGRARSADRRAGRSRSARRWCGAHGRAR